MLLCGVVAVALVEDPACAFLGLPFWALAVPAFAAVDRLDCSGYAALLRRKSATTNRTYSSRVVCIQCRLYISWVKCASIAVLTPTVVDCGSSLSSLLATEELLYFFLWPSSPVVCRFHFFPLSDQVRCLCSVSSPLWIFSSLLWRILSYSSSDNVFQYVAPDSQHLKSISRSGSALETLLKLSNGIFSGHPSMLTL